MKMKAVRRPRLSCRATAGAGVLLLPALLFTAFAGPGCSSGGSGSPSGSGGQASGGTGSGGHGSGGSDAGSGGTTSGSGGSANGTGGHGSGGSGSGGSGSGGHIGGSGGSTTTGSGGAASGGVSGSGGVTGTGGASSGGAAGGATASGGTPATGSGGSGSAGRTGMGGASGGSNGGPGGASGTSFFTADFESDTVGKQPAGWDNFISYNFNTTNPQSDGTGALVDSTRAHGGKNSVHFKSTGNPVMIERALPSGTNRLYVRAYFYMTTQLGNAPQGENHETLLGLNQDPKSANNQVRFGEIKGAIGTNEVPSDNIAPKMASWYMPPVITANAWHCIEVAFLGDQTQNALYAWSDGMLVHSITSGDQWQNGTMPMNWLNGKFVDVMFGWQSFSSQANEVWMDDLVLSTGPIGCN